MKYTDEFLLSELNRVAAIVGHTPTTTQFREHSRIGMGTICQRFGTWNKAIAASGLSSSGLLQCNWDISALAPYDGAWLAGFCDGEACFRIAGPSPSNISANSRSFSVGLQIRLRDDDVAILELVKNIWDITSPVHLYSHAKRRAAGEKTGDEALLDIRNVTDLWCKIIPTFEQYPLRSKKHQDFLLFRRAVDVLAQKWMMGRKNRPYTPDERSELGALFLALKAIKQYNATLEQVCSEHGLDIQLLRF
jgi:hypothetical protein